jgi:uncharacterized cofD-like protein
MVKLLDRLLRREPSIVAIGGGTGLATLLRGLKVHTGKILAVCTVADDGGSSGRLRRDFDILPPGDIRNCLVALSNSGPLLEELFQYRFSESDLRGHSFGNIFLAALTRVTGDFNTAIAEANKILNVRGRVLPATLTKVALVAHHTDGSKSIGESLIGSGTTGKRIQRISLKPEPEPASKEILDGIAAADLIILGPGSVYTSVIPNLLIGGMLPALADSPAIKGYVCNVMTQPGETPGYTASDHAEAVIRHATPGLLDFVVVNTGEISEKMQLKYQAQGAAPVVYDKARMQKLAGDFQVTEADLVNTDNVVRHDSSKLAAAILVTYREILKQRGGKPKQTPWLFQPGAADSKPVRKSAAV